MSFRRFANICAAGSALALALTLATPAAAAGLAGEMPGDAPSYPGPSTGMPMPAAPDMRPEWRGPASASLQPAIMQPDGRARDAWLRECRHRTALYYDYGGYRHHRRHDKDRGHMGGYEGGYDYCEAYFDDYYRTYTQPGYGYAYVYPAMAYMRPVAMAPAPVVESSQPVEEVVTEEYIPMRSRYIPRRAVHDKRIHVAP